MAYFILQCQVFGCAEGMVATGQSMAKADGLSLCFAKVYLSCISQVSRQTRVHFLVGKQRGSPLLSKVSIGAPPPERAEDPDSGHGRRHSIVASRGCRVSRRCLPSGRNADR